MIPAIRTTRLVTGGIACLFLFGCASSSHQSRHEHIHHKGHQVMPFALNKTLHIFRMTASGGVQQVIIRDAADADQVELIQQHLKKEAEAFQRGDYADPASLHGEEMPGLKELQEGASRINVRYRNLPQGAEITYTTTDIELLTAIHRWFGAQLSDHGADARAE